MQRLTMPAQNESARDSCAGGLSNRPPIARRKAFLMVSALATLVLSGLVVWIATGSLNPPMLKIVNIQPADVLDDTGQMNFVTLAFSNPNNANHRENTLHIKHSGIAFQARVANAWVPIEGFLSCSVGPGEIRETLFLVPPNATACRFSLQYTGSHSSKPFKDRLRWLSEKLSSRFPSRIPNKFWNWLGWPGSYLPNSRWKSVIIEIPLPSQPAG